VNKFRKILLVLSLLALPGFALGCGYSARSALPANLRTIHVEPIKNKINYTDENRRNVYFPLMEVNARNAIIDRVLFDGNLRLTEPDMAAMILKGDLVGYERQPIRYDVNEQVEEYRVYVVVNLELLDAKDNLPIWKEPGFTGEATYTVIGANASNEAAALAEAMTDLGRRVVERIVENW
jgi:hypothetical protein